MNNYKLLQILIMSIINFGKLLANLYIYINLSVYAFLNLLLNISAISRLLLLIFPSA